MAFGKCIKKVTRGGMVSIQENGSKLICYVPGYDMPFVVNAKEKQDYAEKFFYYHTMGVM